MNEETETIAPAYLARFNQLAEKFCKLANVDTDESAGKWEEWFRNLRCLYRSAIRQGYSSEKAYDYTIEKCGDLKALAAVDQVPRLVRWIMYQNARIICMWIVAIHLSLGIVVSTLRPALSGTENFQRATTPATGAMDYSIPVFAFMILVVAGARRYLERLKGDSADSGPLILKLAVARLLARAEWNTRIAQALFCVQITLVISFAIALYKAGGPSFVGLQSWEAFHLFGFAQDTPHSILRWSLSLVGTLSIFLFFPCTISLIFDLAYYKKTLLPYAIKLYGFCTLPVRRLWELAGTYYCRSLAKRQK